MKKLSDQVNRILRGMPGVVEMFAQFWGDRYDNDYKSFRMNTYGFQKWGTSSKYFLQYSVSKPVVMIVYDRRTLLKQILKKKLDALKPLLNRVSMCTQTIIEHACAVFQNCILEDGELLFNRCVYMF